MLASLLQTGESIGGSLGPLFGTAIVSVSSFRVMTDSTGALCAFFAIVYFICAKGSHAMILTCKNRRAIKELAKAGPAQDDGEVYFNSDEYSDQHLDQEQRLVPAADPQ